MKHPLLALVLLLCTPAFALDLDGFQPAKPEDFKDELRNPDQGPTNESFAAYVREYNEPELFQKNGAAFAARLKLLHRAPPGSHVKVLTFLFDNGEVTNRLSTHLCLAAKRGVNVELIADSKSGDRIGRSDVFDSASNKVNEEKYQFLANCGVKVTIHNHLAKFNTLFGNTIPQVSSVDTAVTVLLQLYNIGNEVVDIVREQIDSKVFQAEAIEKMKNAGLTKEVLEEIRPHLRRAMVSVLVMRKKGKVERGFWDRTLTLLAKTPGFRDDKIVAMLEEPDTAGEVFDESVAALYERLSSVSFDKINPVDLGRLIAKMKERFNARPDLVAFYENIRRFNRLNHRKLFLVEAPSGDACMFLGGRNLGDHYLAWHHDSFIDGDVLYCRHHGASAADPIKQGAASFNELKQSLRDDVLGKDNDAATTTYAVKPDFEFRQLLVPDWARSIFGIKTRQQKPSREDLAALPAKDRTLLEPFAWKSVAALHGEPLRGASNWRVHRVNWQPKAENDPVRQALVSAINNEQEEVYIETAYAEFDNALRAAVENALKRGVRVRLVTNGLFVSDGPSKLIRLFMGLWLRNMQRDYNGNDPSAGKFTVQFASIEAGHMIHFKGAGFRCQKTEGKEPFRTFLIGSHNFHPRSGYSDKEHALQWDMEARASCRARLRLPARATADAPDLVDYRDKFWTDAQEYYRGRILMTYPTVGDEIKHALSVDDEKMPPERKRRAKMIRDAIYHSDGRLRGGKGTEFFLELLRDSGMRDLLGIVL